MHQVRIFASGSCQDGKGSLAALEAAIEQVEAVGLNLTRLNIVPMRAGWDTPLAKHEYRSGAGPLQALAYAKAMLQEGVFEAVLISGQDDIKTGYTRQEREQLMAVYGQHYPLTQAYTDLSKEFCRQENLSLDNFRNLRDLVFANYQRSAPEVETDPRWFQDITELLRGVDCANPYTDYAGGLLLVRADLLERLEVEEGNLEQGQIEIAGLGLGFAQGDGKNYLEELASYWHLEKAVHYANLEAGVKFADKHRQGQALLEAYTCYPVVPLALLLHSKLVHSWQEIPAWLEEHNLTLNGGMNLNRAPWNLPALRALIEMSQTLAGGSHEYGGVQANGGLGYIQGFAMMRVLT